MNKDFEEKIDQVETLVPCEEILEEDSSEFALFDKIFIPAMKQEGLVIKIDETNQTLEIQYRNGIRQTISIKDARKIKSEPDKSEINLEHISKNRSVDQKIDIHGLRVEEAIPLVDKFLDDAYLAKISQVFILHGVGTGILRDEVKKLLRNHPHVDSFDSMPDHAVVTLKNEFMQSR